jgi:hypothetical protein
MVGAGRNGYKVGCGLENFYSHKHITFKFLSGQRIKLNKLEL